MSEQKKLKVGWFTFTCCEDSTILMTELMNDHWQDWKKYIDFRHARVLKTKNVLDELDVAFVEGAIASEKQAEKLKEIWEFSALNRIVTCSNCGKEAKLHFTPSDTDCILCKHCYDSKSVNS